MDIEAIVKKTIAELERKKMMKTTGSFQKTENVLYNLAYWRESAEPQTVKFVALIDKALDTIKDDKYYEFIQLRYVEHNTFEQIAEYFDISVSSAFEVRRKLINRLRPIIFSAEYIRELYECP